MCGRPAGGKCLSRNSGGLTRPRCRPEARVMLSVMAYRMTALERAFQLARSGQVTTMTEVVKSLKRDGYDTNQIQRPALLRQLTGLIKAARLEAMNAPLT